MLPGIYEIHHLVFSESWRIPLDSHAFMSYTLKS